jgi:hypothetical protein
VFDVASLDLNVRVDEGQYETFPPPIQTYLRDHRVRGALTAHLEGRYPLKNIEQANGKFQANMKNASISFDDVVWPMDKLGLNIEVADAVAEATYHVNALKGAVRGTVALNLVSPRPLQAEWNLNDMQIADALRVVQQGEPKYQGLVRSDGQIRLDLENPKDTLSGTGNVHVEEGKLMYLPIIKEIIQAVSKIQLGAESADQDKANVAFTLHADHINLTDVSVVSSVVAMRGKGRVNFDRTIDMEIKAGPLERLEASLGKIGKFIGTVSDTIVVYTATGTLGNPKIGVKPPDIKSSVEALDVLGVFKK